MKKNIIIALLIISLTISIILFLNNIRDSPESSVKNSVTVNIVNTAEEKQKININNASVEALESLPGIGEVLAGRIVQERPFDDLYELDRVKGIGPKTIERLRGKAVAN